MCAQMSNPDESEPKRKGWFRRVVEKWVDYEGAWVEKNRGNLMTVATLIATITYQAALVPPGGVWGSTTTTDTQCISNGDRECIAGTAVLATGKTKTYFQIFMVLDTIGFMLSLAVLFLLVSGFPPKDKIALWLLTFLVCATVSVLGFSFLVGLILVLPDDTIENLKELRDASLVSWSILVAIVVTVSVFIIVVRLTKRVKRNEDVRRARRADGLGSASHVIAAGNSTSEED